MTAICCGSADGLIVQVRAAAEPVSEVRCDDPLLLARACYHLGNRHVPLQIGDGLLRYQHDHVLDDMLRGLGLQPSLRAGAVRTRARCLWRQSPRVTRHAHAGSQTMLSTEPPAHRRSAVCG